MWQSGNVQLQEFEVRAQVKMKEGVFIRKFGINSFGKFLTLCQKEVGDVSCHIGCSFSTSKVFGSQM
jgi:hypothetical protein